MLTTPQAPQPMGYTMPVLTPDLAAAIVDAQANVEAARKDRRSPGEDGYDYASAEEIIATAKPALRAAGLAVLPLSYTLEPVPANGNGSPGLDVARWYRLIHRTGYIEWQVRWPVHMHGKAKDKAVAGALTSMLGYVLRDLLQIPRQLKGEEGMDERDDRPPPPRESRDDEAARLHEERRAARTGQTIVCGDRPSWMRRDKSAEPAAPLPPDAPITEVLGGDLPPVNVPALEDRLHRELERTRDQIQTRESAMDGALPRRDRLLRGRAGSHEPSTPADAGADVQGSGGESTAAAPRLPEAPGQGASPAVVNGLLRCFCRRCHVEVSDPADALCDRCAGAAVAGGAAVYDGPTLTEALAARGLTHRPHPDSVRHGHDVLRDEEVLLVDRKAREVWEWLALSDEAPEPVEEGQEDEEEAPDLPDEEGPDDWRSRVSPEVAARYDALDAEEAAEEPEHHCPRCNETIVESEGEVCGLCVALGPADLRGQKRAKALERAAQREWSRVVVKRGGGTCASNCGTAFRKGDEAEESGNRRRHVACPKADPRAQEETSA